MTKLSLPLAQWPPKDRRAWDTAIAGGDILDGRGPAAHWAPATMATNVYHYGQWLAFLETAGGLDRDTDPASRCSRQTLGSYLTWLNTTSAPVTVASNLIGLAVMLKAMAPDIDWTWLSKICNRLKRGAKPKRDKRSRILTSGEIFKAALTQLENLSVSNQISPQQNVAFRNALMLGVLVGCPIRLKNFTALRPGHTLLKIDGNWRIKIPAAEVKNKVPIDLDVPTELGPYLDLYIERVRPALLGTNTTDALWIRS